MRLLTITKTLKTTMGEISLVDASLAATDFAEEYPVNITSGHFQSEE